MSSILRHSHAVLTCHFSHWLYSALGNTQALEVNAVQTGSSAGSSIASGVIYTLPGLYLIGYWDSIQYWETMLCALFGGFLGVLFSIPLRRALIIEANLNFPEGRATAEVLKVMSGLSSHKVQFAMIGAGATVGALLKLVRSLRALLGRAQPSLLFTLGLFASLYCMLCLIRCLLLRCYFWVCVCVCCCAR
jgi:putative OPT family oligopeptide transporter